MGQDSTGSGVSTHRDLSERTYSRVRKWEKEVKSHYRLDHIPDPAGEIQLAIQLLQLSEAIKKAQWQFFTAAELHQFTWSTYSCQSIDQETCLKLFNKLKDGRYYDVIRHFVPKRREEEYDDAILDRLFKSWENEFKGASLMALCDYVMKLEKDWAGTKHYAKIIPVIQSSGMGKSRLLSEFGKTTLSVYYTTRRPNETGYLPAMNRFRNCFPKRSMMRSQMH
jgi:hypothetical protein